MGYLGYKPADKPLTSADITDSIITSAKITDATIVNGDIANSTIALAKLSATGTPSAATFLRGDNTWGSAGAAAGQVIQVVSNSYSGDLSTSSTSYVATGYTATITPSSASNKILIFVNGGVSDYDSGTPQIHTKFYSNINSAGYNSITNQIESLKMPEVYTSPHSMSYYYSPSTTSSTIIQPYFKSSSGDNVYFNRSFGTVTITLMEIKG
jgi:hypothetical protein